MSWLETMQQTLQSSNQAATYQLYLIQDYDLRCNYTIFLLNPKCQARRCKYQFSVIGLNLLEVYRFSSSRAIHKTTDHDWYSRQMHKPLLARNRKKTVGFNTRIGNNLHMTRFRECKLLQSLLNSSYYVPLYRNKNIEHLSAIAYLLLLLWCILILWSPDSVRRWLLDNLHTFQCDTVLRVWGNPRLFQNFQWSISGRVDRASARETIYIGRTRFSHLFFDCIIYTLSFYRMWLNPKIKLTYLHWFDSR